MPSVRGALITLAAGAALPQGVNCTIDEFLGGGCLTRLRAYISETGGSYSS